MSYTYSQYIVNLANMLVVSTTQAEYLTVLPSIIDDAEQRIYRELDLLNTIVSDSSTALSTSTKSFNLPTATATFQVIETINVITPAGTTNPDSGTRNALTPLSRSVIDFLYPSSSYSTVPQYFAMLSQSTIVVGPWPNAAYQVEVVGTQRPAPLSVTNTTTLLSTYLPDLFLAASMVFGSGYQKNFGAAVDDPKMAVTWESHYKELLQSAQVEEARKKFTSQGWSSKQPAQVATPPRT